MVLNGVYGRNGLLHVAKPHLIARSFANFLPYQVSGLLMSSNRQSFLMYCTTNLILLRLGLAEGCEKPSLPIGDEPIPIPLFYMSRLKV